MTPVFQELAPVYLAVRYCGTGIPEFPVILAEPVPVFRSAVTSVVPTQGTVHGRQALAWLMAGGPLGPKGHFHRPETKKDHAFPWQQNFLTIPWQFTPLQLVLIGPLTRRR